MYIYFDSNGTIKEIVNDVAIRKGSADYNKLYVYIEGNPEIDDIWYFQKFPNGSTSNQVSFINNVVIKSIPYDAKRDMTYFKDFVQYKFYVFTLTSEYLNISGLAIGTIRIAIDNSIFALGELTFNIQANEVKEDNNITQSQYDYLLLAYASRTLNEQTGSDLDTLLDEKIEAKATDIIEPIFETYKSTIDDEVEAQNETIASLSQASPSVFDTASNITALTENKGVAVATDTGYIYYWDSTLTTPAYVSSGLQYNSLANYTKHSGNQLQDGNGNNFYPIIDETKTYALAKSTNLFDRLSVLEKSQINNSGVIEDYNNCYVMNNPINIIGGEKLVYFIDGGQENAISSDGFLAYYDINGNFISKTRADGGASGTIYTVVTSGITPNYYRVLVRYYTVPNNAVTAIWQGYTNQLSLVDKICIQHLADFTGNYQDYYATIGGVDDYSVEKIKFSWKPTWDISQAPYIFAGTQGVDGTYTSSALASIMVAINSCAISKNYRDNRNKTSNHYSHDSTLQILNDKGYIIETRDETGTGDNPSVLTAYVGLTVYDDVKTVSTSSTNTKYDVAKNGDSVGALTITSGVAEANCYLLGTDLYIIFTCKLSDNNWYELYRIFDTTTNTFGNIGICKLGANDFTCANLCTALGIGDVQSSISMNATITTDGTYYYAGLCLGSNVPTSVIMYSNDFITWNVWLKPSDNAPTNAIFENAIFVKDNFLYSACRQTNGFIWLAKIRISNKNIEKSILINADSCRPDFFTDGTNLYLAYSVNNRNLTQIMRISTTLERSKVVSQIIDECIYPSIKYSSDNQVIISATANNSTAVYLRRTTAIEPYNIYDMLDLLMTMFGKFNEV